MSSVVPHTLDNVRALVREIAASLDPDSRYIADLSAIVSASKDVLDFERRMMESCRGLRHSGTDVFARMTLAEKVRANLITPETALFRFTEGELEALDREILPRIKGKTARILVVPCSHGEEAFTLAAYFLKVKQTFQIRAFDIQPALIEEARSGRLTFGFPEEFLAKAGKVSDSVLSCIRFEVGDAFALPLAADDRFEIILCRNFLGYFTAEKISELTRFLAGRVAPGGVLFLDGFCVQKNSAVLDVLSAQAFRRSGSRPVFFAP